MVKKVTLSCDTCIWNDDGLCDRIGRFVDPDDKCEEWALSVSENVRNNEKK